jgi:signal transduction histidine kinase/CheY-like chemotaxis protein
MQSLRLRILTIALTPALVGLVLLTLYFSNRTLDEAEQALMTRGRDIARHLAVAAEYDFIMGNDANLKRLLDHTASRPEVLAIGLMRPDGAWHVVTGRAALLASIERQEGLREFALGAKRVFIHPLGRTAPSDADPYLVAASQGQGVGQVAVVLGTASLEQTRADLLTGAAVLAALFLPLVGAIAWRMSHGLSSRLRALSQAVERIADGQLSVRVEATSSGELGLLERNVNRMASALQEGREGLERRIHEATAELSAQKQAAETAVQVKSRFLAAASHDLRQPLHALTLLVAALKERLASGGTRQLVQHIEASALAMQELLNALLDLSRLDAGVVVAHPECFPLARVLQGIQRQFAPLAAEKGFVLHVRTTQAWSYTDPLLVERILINLVANAIRYTESGWVSVGARQEGDKLRLEVWDTGPGIPKAYQDRIFEEYFQLVNPERSRDKGLGLGLAIVARLARLLGTSVNVYSEPGKGSCFSLRLPACQAQTRGEDTAAATGSADAQLEHALVACIDDDQSILEAMVELLAGWDVEVAAGPDAAQVQADLTQLGRSPDVIVSDYRLAGGRSGLEAIAALRRTFGAHIPAVLITGDTAAETIQAIDASGLPVLHKPLRPAKLRAMLSHLLAGRRAAG